MRRTWLNILLKIILQSFIPAGGSYNTAISCFRTTFVNIANLGTVKKNQHDDGSRWVSLGKYNFTTGWNQVAVSRWAPTGTMVIADAIKVE